MIIGTLQSNTPQHFHNREMLLSKIVDTVATSGWLTVFATTSIYQFIQSVLVLREWKMQQSDNCYFHGELCLMSFCEIRYVISILQIIGAHGNNASCSDNI